jgi:hypothetical protein
MPRTPLAAVLLFCAAAFPLGAQTQWETVRLKDVEISARLIQDVDRIVELLGDDLDKDFTLVEMRVKPMFDTVVELSRDDFTLRTFANNDSSNAQSPDRIAGSAVLTLGSRTTGGGGVFSESREAVIVGGAPGTGTRPKRLGGVMDNVGSSGTSTTETEIQSERREDDSLAGKLARLELPLEGSIEEREGFLYFQIPPKHKLKHLSLSYQGRYGEFKLTFQK